MSQAATIGNTLNNASNPINNPMGDNEFLQYGTTNPFYIGSVTTGTPGVGIITAPTVPITLFTLPANRNYDFFNNAGFTPTNPAFIITSAVQERNTFGAFQVISADRTFNIFGIGSDDVDGTARNIAGMSISLGAEDGGSLGGAGGFIRQRTGSATFGNFNGGDHIFQYGQGHGSGLDGAIVAQDGDLRFRKNGGGNFKLFSATTDTDYIYFDVINDGMVDNGVIGSSSGTNVFAGAIRVGTGLSVIEGRVHIGGTTDTSGAEFLIDQPAATATSGVAALQVNAGAHTNMLNVGVTDFIFSAARNIEFAGGGASIPSSFTTQFFAPTYTALAAQDISVVAHAIINGPPILGTNVTSSIQIGLVVGDFNTQNYTSSSAVNLVALTPGIGEGVGNADLRVAFYVPTVSSTTILGDTNGTLSLFAPFSTHGNQLATTGGAARTVTRVANYHSGDLFTASGDVTITEGIYAFLAQSGPSRFAGNVIVGPAFQAGTTANGVLALSNGATAPTTSVDLAQLSSIDIAAGRATLALTTEETVAADIALASTNSLTVFINGSKYKILLTLVP